MLLLVAMVAAQVAIDAMMSGFRDALHGALDLRGLLGEGWLYAVDVALTPVGIPRRTGSGGAAVGGPVDRAP